jgi:predicted transcriptional regulator
MGTASFTFRIDRDLRERLEAEARAEERSSGAIAQRAIQEFLDQRDAFRRAVDEGEAEADAGLLIDGEAVTEWVAGWGKDDAPAMPTLASHPFRT